MKKIHELYRLGVKIYERFDHDLIQVYAAQASFFIVISAVPFVMLLIAIIRNTVIISFEYHEIMLLANAYMPQKIYEFISELISGLYSAPTVSLISITTVTLLWSASKGVKSLGAGIRNVYNLNNSNGKNGFIKSILMSFVYTIMFIIISVVSLSALFVTGFIEEYLIQHFNIRTGLLRLIFNLRALIFIGILIIVFMITYKALSSHSMKFRAHFFGALFSSCGWSLFSWIYSLYIDHFATNSYIYGSLTALVLLMLWLFICMVILLIGAEINVWIYSKRYSRKMGLKN